MGKSVNYEQTPIPYPLNIPLDVLDVFAGPDGTLLPPLTFGIFTLASLIGFANALM